MQVLARGESQSLRLAQSAANSRRGSPPTAPLSAPSTAPLTPWRGRRAGGPGRAGTRPLGQASIRETTDLPLTGGNPKRSGATSGRRGHVPKRPGRWFSRRASVGDETLQVRREGGLLVKVRRQPQPASGLFAVTSGPPPRRFPLPASRKLNGRGVRPARPTLASRPTRADVPQQRQRHTFGPGALLGGPPTVIRSPRSPRCGITRFPRSPAGKRKRSDR